MKMVHTTILAALILLAAASGITKISLLQQDVDFFGKYGFSDPILIAYGLLQLLGGVLMAVRKTRLVGASTVAITFLVSLLLLLVEGNLTQSIITVIAILMLGWIAKLNWNANLSIS